MTAFGWRGRIGLILPADNTVIEPELYGLGLPGISFHTTRLSVTDHDAMREQAVSAATAFAEMGVDVVVYACAETSFDGGDDARTRLPAVIGEVCGVPVVTATDAMLDGVAQLGLKKVALISPYKPVSATLLEETLTQQGLEVVGARHRDFRVGSPDPREWFETNRQPSTTVYRMAREADTPDADGVVVCSTNWPSLPVHEQLEADLGKPVVSSNQAALWWCLRELGISEPISYGRLLREPR